MRPPFKFCYITDRRGLAGGSLSESIRAAVMAGIDLIQIREKDLATRDLLAVSEQAAACARGTASSIIVNDRFDIALAGGATGVHLGTRSLPAGCVRSMVPKGFMVGVSCHSLADVLEAEAAGADYVLLGPIFETPSKLKYGPPLGLGVLREAALQAAIPVYALGGIMPDRIRSCLETGAAGIAGIRIFQEAPSLEERVAELRGRKDANHKDTKTSGL